MKKGEIAFLLPIILAVIMITLIIGLAVYSIYEEISYGTKEGIIIDKKYSPSHTYTTTTTSYTKNGTINLPTQNYAGEKYTFKIQKEVDRELKSIFIDVTYDEFINYNVGDYFKR